jgi:hypothetical protein
LETKSKEEIELLHTNINDKCSQLLEANMKLMNPNLVIYNVPEEEWEASTKGELTETFFPNVKDRISKRLHMSINDCNRTWKTEVILS